MIFISTEYTDENSSIEIYDMDTPSTISNRIAAALNTLPAFLHLETVPTAETLPNTILTAVVLDDMIRNKNYNTLFSAISDLIALFQVNDIIYVWSIIYPAPILEMEKKRIEETYDINMQDIMQKQTTDKQVFLNTISSFLKQEQQVENIFKRLHEIPAYPVTEFVVDRSNVSYPFEFKGNLFSVFNQLHISTQYPCIFYHDYYKLLHSFVPPANWGDSEDRIVIKHAVPNSNEFVDFYIYPSDTNSPTNEVNSFTVSTNANTNDSNRTISRVADILKLLDAPALIEPSEIMQEKLILSNITGDMGIDIPLDMYVISDLLVTVPELYVFFAGNDTAPIQSKYQHQKFLFSNNIQTLGKGGLETPQSVLASSFTIRKAKRDYFFAYRTVYTNVHVTSSGSLEQIEQFRKMVQKLVYIYTQQWETIQSVYSAFGMTWGDEEVLDDEHETTVTQPKQKSKPTKSKQPKKDGKVFLKDIDPVVFGNKYTIRCQPSTRHPSIIQNDEVEEYKQKGHEVMTFPKDDAIAPMRNYVCLDKTYPFPGLVVNQNSKLGYQPCCFKVDQKTKPKYKKYFQAVPDVSAQSASPRLSFPAGIVSASEPQPESETQPELETQQQQMYMKKTDKIIQSRSLGYFPDSTGAVKSDIALCFEYCVPPDTVILRRGVNHTPHSLIECVLIGSGIDLPVDPEQRRIFIESERLALSRMNVALARQECYNMTEEEIVEEIRNMNVFLNPLKYIRLLELKYECTLLIFGRDSEHPEGSILIPNHKHGYYQNRRNTQIPSIFIYMHSGPQKHQLSYPHCEVIIHVDATEIPNLQKSYDLIDTLDPNPNYFEYMKDSSLGFVYTFCWNVFDKLSQFYVYNSVVTQYESVKDVLPILAQFIDEYGKVRQLLVQFQNTEFTVETSPLVPMDVPLFTPSPRHANRVNSAVAQKFVYTFCRPATVSIFNINSHTQYVEGRFMESAFDIRVYINSDYEIYPSTELSQRRVFLENNLIARCLTNWFHYLFSKYMFANSITDMNSDHLKQFIETSVRINPDKVYQPVGQFFDKAEATGIFQGSYLVCTNSEILRRLVFQLQLVYERHRDKLRNFHRRQYLDGYFLNVNDFTTHPNQLILYYNRTYSNTPLVSLLQETYQPYLLTSYPSPAPDTTVAIAEVRNTRLTSTTGFFNPVYKELPVDQHLNAVDKKMVLADVQKLATVYRDADNDSYYVLDHENNVWGTAESEDNLREKIYSAHGNIWRHYVKHKPAKSASQQNILTYRDETYKIIDVAGDGSCMFHTVVYFLTHDLPHLSITAQELRRKTVDFIGNNMDLVISDDVSLWRMIELSWGVAGKTFEDYKRAMLTNEEGINSWGGYGELVAIALMYNIEFVVYTKIKSTNRVFTTKIPNQDVQNPFKLLLTVSKMGSREIGHYQVLVPNVPAEMPVNISPHSHTPPSQIPQTSQFTDIIPAVSPPRQLTTLKTSLPYFVNHFDFTGNTVLLATNTHTLEDALKKSYFWEIEQYNSIATNTVTLPENHPYYLYVIFPDKTLRVIRVGDVSPVKDRKLPIILAFFTNADTPKKHTLLYTPLLELY